MHMHKMWGEHHFNFDATLLPINVDVILYLNVLCPVGWMLEGKSHHEKFDFMKMWIHFYTTFHIMTEAHINPTLCKPSASLLADSMVLVFLSNYTTR